MSASALPRSPARGASLAYWITTTLFSVMMGFAAVAYLTQPAMAQAFTHLGLPHYLRVELAIAKLLGVAALLAPVPQRVKEWAYAGFSINLLSAIIAHASVDGPATAVAPVLVAVLLLASYITWLRR